MYAKSTRVCLDLVVGDQLCHPDEAFLCTGKCHLEAVRRGQRDRDLNIIDGSFDALISAP